ncbi:MAG: PAS domain-containing protein [Firmicutes bacterium]|nr:PAS domain-containing protein [Bacillota bacterium]
MSAEEHLQAERIGASRSSAPLGATALGLRPAVAESWARCREMGLHPANFRVQTVGPDELERRREALHPLLAMARPLLGHLAGGFPADGAVAALVDADGVVLVVAGEAEEKLVPGQRLTEDSAGTTAVSLALAERRPQVLTAAEHYYEAFRTWTWAAAPISGGEDEWTGLLVLAAKATGRHDLMDRAKEAAAALAAAWRAYREAVERRTVMASRAPWPILAVDAQGRLLDCNPAAEAALRRSRERVLGRRLGELVRFDDDKERGRYGRLQPEEVVVCLPGAREPQAFLVQSAPLDEDRTGDRVVSAVNVTPLRRKAERFDYRQRLALLDRLASFAVHEIRNPLAAIRVTAELASMTPKEDRRSALMEQIIASIDELEGFLEELLALARPEQLQLAPVDVGRLVHRICGLFEAQAEAMGVAIRLRGMERLPMVKGNEQLLGHALMNLLKNALQAMPDGGTVTVCAEHRPNSGFVRIAVKDTGTGIPKAHRRHLFTGAVSTKGREGAGLGLLFTHRIITDIHRGRLWFRTREGTGTTFYIELPVCPEAMGGSEAV